MATAQVLLNRLFYVASLAEIDLQSAVLGALLLASKVEEVPIRMRDIIIVVDMLIKRDRRYPMNVLETHCEEYLSMKDDMVNGELFILRSLGFNVRVQLPYGMMVTYLRSLGLANHEIIPQMSWNYLNDGLRSNVYVCYQPQAIACAAIFLAARQCGVKLTTGVPWWEVFDTNERDMLNIARTIMRLYFEPQQQLVPLNQDELKFYLKATLEQHINVERARRQQLFNVAADDDSGRDEHGLPQDPVAAHYRQGDDHNGDYPPCIQERT
ncbi:hypothetical protein EV182_000155 [Spiromyces aspiralis]|uniref:Uncharacterized protein n=1 Tax=Spiromyces aspiralis TaxID=68401 RepID=A0ACC1HX63_9FUNG|nr:hypothetical protein EV182_000155 [Spiromyces aspiralis]